MEKRSSSPHAGARRFAINTGWNVIGQLLPLPVGVLVVRALIGSIGMDRYGFLSLVWVMVGYAGFFDFGINRALTRTVALRLANGDEPGARHIANVGMTFLLLFGLVVGAFFCVASGLLVRRALGVPPHLQEEAARAVWWVGLSIPFVLTTAGYSGILSAFQKFPAMNVIKIAMGVATYIVPLLVSLINNRLEYVVGAILVLRVVTNSAHAWVCHRECAFRFKPGKPDKPTAHELFSLGGWMSVTNFVSPLMTYLDRLLMGSLLNIRMVAFYSTPYDLVNRSMVLPNAIMGVVFPMASGLRAGTEGARSMLSDSIRLLFVIMYPVIFGFFVVAHVGFEIWLGSDFAAHSAVVLQILCIGVLANALAQPPAVMIQAAGHPKWMAILHVIELPLFLVALYGLTSRYGIIGTAIASTLRNVLDAMAVYVMAVWGTSKKRLELGPALVPTALGAALLVGSLFMHGWQESVAYLIGGLSFFAWWAWNLLLKPQERDQILHVIKIRTASQQA